MTTFEVLDRFGTAALVRFVGALVLFLALHLIRMPLVVLVRVLETCMRRVDQYATRQATPTNRPTRPHTQWFPDTAKEDSHVYAA